MNHSHHIDRAGRLNRDENQKRLFLVFLLTATYLIVELIGALLSNSLALLADAGHMFSDVAALAVSLFAALIARRSPTPKRTYGYYRSEILAALFNGAALIGIAFYIFIEAFGRFRHPPEIKSGLMAVVATGGLLVNIVSLSVLFGGNRKNLNFQGAFLHVLNDTLGSVGALASALLVGLFGWAWADPAASILIAFLVISSAWPLLKESVAIIMESVPAGIDSQSVRRAIAQTSGVAQVNDLHIWAINKGLTCLSAHVAVARDEDRQDTLDKLKTLLRDRFEIRHVTIQIESVDPDIHPSQRNCSVCE